MKKLFVSLALVVAAMGVQAASVAVPASIAVSGASGSTSFWVTPDYTGNLAAFICSGPSGLSIRNNSTVSKWPTRTLPVDAGSSYSALVSWKNVATPTTWSVCFSQTVGGSPLATVSVTVTP